MGQVSWDGVLEAQTTSNHLCILQTPQHFCPSLRVALTTWPFLPLGPGDSGGRGPLLISAGPQTWEVSDRDQQVWVLQGETLVMVPRSSNVTPGEWSTVLTCPSPHGLLSKCEDRHNFLFSSWLFCPTFQEQNILDLYNQVEPVRPFLFYHSRDGNTSSFESVAFPGWLIASSQVGQPIFLTSDLGTTNNTNFYLNLKA
uniref:Interleukin-36 receptor antagonist protein n=1 Tax=Urocitellus parryii TaxID=9999 RepID=A0A8D2H666_UROPR